MEDQLPVSQDEEVKVEILKISNATLNPVSGMLTWKLDIKPGESKEITLSFSVQYPKNKAGKTFNLFNSKVSKYSSKARF